MSIVESLNRYMPVTYAAMRNNGLLLGSVGSDRRPNLMTIRWGLIGVIWNKPIFLVAVRISMYTHKLLEETGEFTVNVPAEDMSDACKICGTMSGRDIGKFERTGLRWKRGEFVRAPIVKRCSIAYECRVLYKNPVNLQTLPKDLVEIVYPRRDWHTLYYGEILKIHGKI